MEEESERRKGENFGGVREEEKDRKKWRERSEQGEVGWPWRIKGRA